VASGHIRSVDCRDKDKPWCAGTVMKVTQKSVLITYDGKMTLFIADCVRADLYLCMNE